MQPPRRTFQTTRFILRPPVPEDAEMGFHAYANDPVVTKYLIWNAYQEVELLRLFYSQCRDQWENGGPGHYMWLICNRDSGAPIGAVSATLDRFTATLGYVIGRAHWGQGCATEVVSEIVGWAQTQSHIYRVWAYCDVDNPASARVMEKAGLVREAILRRWHLCSGTGPEPRDCIACSWVR